MTSSDPKSGDERLTVEPGARRRLATPTFERIGSGPLRPLGSGELNLPRSDFSDVSVDVPMPSGEQEVGALRVARPIRERGRWERSLGLCAAGALLLLVLILFGEALVGGVRAAISGRSDDRWRAVQLSITSYPSRAQVFIQGRLVGQTPLEITRRCRGRTVRVRMALPGYQVWQWRGLCPASGTLILEAVLQPQGRR
jgi:hypothetical protein